MTQGNAIDAGPGNAAALPLLAEYLAVTRKQRGSWTSHDLSVAKRRAGRAQAVAHRLLIERHRDEYDALYAGAYRELTPGSTP